ncbi:MULTISPECIES: PDR/VanB family oxidoreductase [unclassified Herbaspirillum]|uniref:PDR/VanB family oxidoreductase n=1 Tax=unclassified Herbaspirillum TaxID=2624150 RepID=UPI000C0A09A7|nr:MULTISPECIES: PDR/VanB family oxidoreductase [unclassified Herbaspirillum]MAF05305.1 oxidoreductase [Herbaspirillum sp.]MBO15012.1 oxidoreductase [Herbaspirillum sp.]|tara:strand:- start:640 stop:1608 length:969 start_codon:yes stop_codon:yes gene_type:complete
MKLIVDTLTDETGDIRSFRLVRADGAPLPAYEPGAHIDVTGPTGIMRQYSLCGPLEDRCGYTIAVKREPASRGGSAALHDAVKPGMELEVGTPRNLFALDAGAQEHLLFGAGIGVTPLLAMAYRLWAEQKPFTLHYFVRAREHAAFADLLENAPFAAQVRFHYAVMPAQMDHYLTACLAAGSKEAHVYTCGPAPFMDAVVKCAAASRSEEAIHLEHFAAPVAPAASAQGADGGDAAFEVKLASSGKVVQIPVGIPIVDILAREGIVIDTSCREGICGTCVVPLLEGEPDHRDNCLSKKEKAANDQICTCVSRARSGMLVLDL